jgi:hypothetical protein
MVSDCLKQWSCSLNSNCTDPKPLKNCSSQASRGWTIGSWNDHKWFDDDQKQPNQICFSIMLRNNSHANCMSAPRDYAYEAKWSRCVRTYPANDIVDDTQTSTVHLWDKYKTSVESPVHRFASTSNLECLELQTVRWHGSLSKLMYTAVSRCNINLFENLPRAVMWSWAC